MKVEKRLSEEFGMDLPPPTPWYWQPMTINRIAEWVVGHLLHFTIIPALLASGAVIGRYYPPAVWWLFGTAGVAALCIAALFVIVLIANSMDDPMDGYPGS